MLKRSLIILIAVLGCRKASSDEKTPPAGGGSGAKPVAPPPASGFTAADGDKEISLDEATAGLPKDGKLMAEITTDLGSIECTLLPDSAPKTVASFVGLARGLRAFQDPASGKWMKGPFFDGTAFHRVIPKFMIQGGDPKSRTDYGADDIGVGGPGYTLPDEIDPHLNFDQPGRMAMANTGPHTHSGGSQFFITEVPYPSLNQGYVIFGQCDNADIEKAIARVATDDPRHNKPLKPITMKVRIYKK
jgi:cyclophilin family peptidyl-prolyl cis-trans isomerase